MARRTVRTLDGRDPHRVTIGSDSTVAQGAFQGRIVAFTRTGAGHLQVLVERGDGMERLAPGDLFRDVLAVAAPDHDPDPRLVPPGTPEWEALSEAEKATKITLARHLIQAQTGSPTGTPDLDRATGTLDPRYDPKTTTDSERVRAKCEELRELGLKPHSRAQVYRLLRALNTDGLSGLVHGNRRTHHDHLTKFDPETVALARTFLSEHKKRAKVSVSALAAQLHAHLISHSHATDLSRYAVTQLVGSLSRGKALHGQAASRRTHSNKPLVAYGEAWVSRPGERIQIDATATAIKVFNPDAGWGAATILSAVDVYTRSVLALRVLAGTAPTSRDVGGLLWDIGRPTVTRAGWPYELQHWHGIPRLASVVTDPDLVALAEGSLDLIGEKLAVHPTQIILDHGGENTSVHLVGAAARNGIDLVFCPPGQPHTKGVVESIHRAYDRVQSLLGEPYHGASAANFPKDATEHAVLTCLDLQDLLWTYLLEVYMHAPHEGLRRVHRRHEPVSPAGILHHYLSHGGTIDAPTDPWRYLSFLTTRECAINDYGIRIDNRIYNSTDVLAIRSYYQRGAGMRARTATVYYDRYDVTRVYLKHPATGQWLCIPRSDPTGNTAAPYSEILTRLAVRDATAAGNLLTPEQLHRAEVQFCSAWSYGVFKDRREARLAAIEATRAATFAHDMADATAEIRDLAFPNPSAEDELNRPGFCGGSVTWNQPRSGQVFQRSR